MLKRVTMLAGAAALLVGMAPPASALPVITQLPLLRGTFSGYTTDINKEVTIVGSSNMGSGGSLAAKWDEAGTVTELPGLPGETLTVAYGINEGGTIVGVSGDSALRWNTDGSVTNLGGLAGWPKAAANDINDSGISVGYARDDKSGESRAVRWQPAASGAEELARLSTFDNAVANDINSAGTIVGQSGWQAVRWNPNGTVDPLPMLPGGSMSQAFGINSSGTIVGEMFITGQRWRAVRWNPDGSVTDLGTLPGGGYAVAHAISENGFVVGQSEKLVQGQPVFHAAYWSPDGSVTDLGILPNGQHSNAMGVADSGYVAGASGGFPVRWSTL